MYFFLFIICLCAFIYLYATKDIFMHVHDFDCKTFGAKIHFMDSTGQHVELTSNRAKHNIYLNVAKVRENKKQRYVV